MLHLEYTYVFFCCILGDLLHSLYPELLKRMDDSNDEIRVFVTKTLLTFFRYSAVYAVATNLY